jgi:hypothetical protein
MLAGLAIPPRLVDCLRRSYVLFVRNQNKAGMIGYLPEVLPRLAASGGVVDYLNFINASGAINRPHDLIDASHCKFCPFILRRIMYRHPD